MIAANIKHIPFWICFSLAYYWELVKSFAKDVLIVCESVIYLLHEEVREKTVCSFFWAYCWRWKKIKLINIANRIDKRLERSDAKEILKIIKGILYKDEKQTTDNNTLDSLTLLIAESNPKEKDVIIDLVMNFLNNDS